MKDFSNVRFYTVKYFLGIETPALSALDFHPLT